MRNIDDGQRSRDSAGCTARSPADVRETLVELKRGTPFRAVLLDAATQQPMAGVKALYGLSKDARYFIWREMDDFSDGHHGLKHVRRAVTSNAGELAFGEDQERGTLFIRHPGYARTIFYPKDRLTHDEQGRVIIPLAPQAVVTGKYIVDECDVMLAVWDGERAHGRGGTADVVEYARENRRTIVHVNPVSETIHRM